VRSNVANSTASLTWPNVATARRGVNHTLTDLATGTTRDMRSNSSYTWQTGDGAATRQFRIDVTTGSRGGLRITAVTPRTIGRSAGVSFSYNLSAAANVDIRVLSSSGTVVRQLNGRSSRAAGIQQATWDQKSDAGVAMPAGPYLVEIRAQAPDGSQSARAVAPFVVTR